MGEFNFSDKFLKTYQKGENVFLENSVGNHMYVINTGCVNISKNIQGTDVIIATLGIGDIFGEMALVDSLPRSATAVAADDNTRLLEIDHALFVYLVGQQPAFALAILKALSLRLREEVAKHAMTSPDENVQK